MGRRRPPGVREKSGICAVADPEMGEFPEQFHIDVHATAHMCIVDNALSIYQQFIGLAFVLNRWLSTNTYLFV